jgi:molybdenum cofactor cytidylyltransferase
MQALLQLQQQAKQPMAACYYAQVLGTPALFHASIFNDLMALKGDMGAKKIINAREEEVAKLHFEKGMIDIDTIEDYQNLIKQWEATEND